MGVAAPVPVPAASVRFHGDRLPARVEMPTLWVAIACHATWALAVWLGGAGMAPVWIWGPLAALAAAWQASLQHEVIHGHPTPWPSLNRVIAGPPLLLWLSFAHYRRSHLAHHRDDRLTDPLDDPESGYVTARTWQRIGPIGRGLLWVVNTLAGRLVLGPPLAAARSARELARDVVAGPDRWRRRAEVVGHGVQVAGLLILFPVLGIGVGDYLVWVVWPATGLLLLRSFIEHRPDADPARRSVVVERGGWLGLLYLGNNLHALHHARPGLPWYELGALFERERETVLARNGYFAYRGYGSVFKAFLITPRDHPVHPSERTQIFVPK